jgi:uncharacterized protein (TIGR03083 family)
MDAIEEWTRAQGRVIALVQSLSATAAHVLVPSCPDWTVRELLSHMVGLDVDVLAGDEPDDHNSTWTQRQVDERAAHDTETIVAEWLTTTAPLQRWMADNSTRPLGDVVIHEQDLRGALNAPGARDTDGLAALRDRMAAGFAAGVAQAGLPTVALVSDSWSFSAGDGEPAVTITASEYDLTRALMSRRSATQLRKWTVRGNLEPYLAVFAALGPLPETDLVE